MPSPKPATSVGSAIAPVGRTQAETVQACVAPTGGGPSNHSITPGPLPRASTLIGPKTVAPPAASTAG